MVQGVIEMTTNIDLMQLICEIEEAYNKEHSNNLGAMDSPGFILDINDFGEFKCIEQVGGEDEGRYAHTIFKWKDVYYKMTYSYASYDGYNFDDGECFVVTPKEKMVTVYE